MSAASAPLQVGSRVKFKGEPEVGTVSYILVFLDMGGGAVVHIEFDTRPQISTTIKQLVDAFKAGEVEVVE